MLAEETEPVGTPVMDPPVPHKKRPSLLNGEPLTAKMQWYIPPRRPYTRRELIADRIVNVAGASMAWIGAPALSSVSWQMDDPVMLQVGVLASGLGLIVMLNCSAIYHFKCWDWSLATRLYSLDHIGISAMIMGTYSPIMVYAQAYIILAFVWGLGTVGWAIEARKLLKPQSPTAGERTAEWSFVDKFNLVRYLLMGWAGLPLGPALIASNPSLCFMALLGGLMYTGGIIFFVRGNMEFHLAIWHGFVLLASVCFYLLIALYIVGQPLLAYY